MKVLVATVSSPDDRSALASIRALAIKGERSYAGGTHYFGQAFHSRQAAGRIRYPHPAQNDEAFAQRLTAECRRLGIEVILPISDYIVEAISRRRDELARNISFPIPPTNSLSVARDKLRTCELARILGLDTPYTVCPANREELRRAATEFRFPVVVKPRKSLGAVGLWLARSEDELVQGYDRGQLFADEVFDFSRPLIQEFIPGEVHDACVLFRDGEPVVGLTQRRILMYPPGAGAGVLNETTWEPELLERAFTLLKALRWHGPAQVEFKVDMRSGRACLLEINGRFWGTLDLSVHAGVNFPFLSARMALGCPVRAPHRYRVGLQYRWPLPYSLLLFLRPETRWKAVKLFFPGVKETITDVQLNDPAPHLWEAAFAVYRMFRRRSMKPLRDLGPAATDLTARDTGGRW